MSDIRQDQLDEYIPVEKEEYQKTSFIWEHRLEEDKDFSIIVPIGLMIVTWAPILWIIHKFFYAE